LGKTGIAFIGKIHFSSAKKKNQRKGKTHEEGTSKRKGRGEYLFHNIREGMG